MAHSNEQAAHIWAQQNGRDGKAGNLFSEGETIYSYGRHYPVARFATPAVVLFSNASSTMTTETKHKPPVRRALHGLPVTCYSVDNPLASYDREHLENIAGMRRDYDALILRAARARDNAESYLQYAKELADTCSNYAATFGVAFPMFPAISPELLAEAKAKAAKATKEKAAQTAERAKARAQELKEAAQEWREGKRDYMPCAFGYNSPTMLRLSQGGKYIQTSRGAKVPVSVAPMVWNAATHCRKNAECHTFAIPRPELGPFTLDRIDAAGNIAAGCHSIPFSELVIIATALNYSDAGSY